jgi:hypothetical protein
MSVSFVRTSSVPDLNLARLKIAEALKDPAQEELARLAMTLVDRVDLLEDHLSFIADKNAKIEVRCDKSGRDVRRAPTLQEIQKDAKEALDGFLL